MDLLRKKANVNSLDNDSHLSQCLGFWDLLFLGVGAIIGAGIFILTGIVAAVHTGPAIVISYVIAGLACAFAALAYAELAAMLGGCGSAYGYAYAGFGEIVAWIVGWDLLLEYAVSVSAVSVGWSGYVGNLLSSMHLAIPAFLWHGPLAGGVVNLLSLMIIVLLTLLLAYGVKSSSRANNLIVMVKLFVIALFIITALLDVETRNWSPFMPFGWSGVVQGASLIFFAYIGFDAVSTAAEEAINPQRDIPRGIVGSLLLCTVLYIAVSFLLTGMVSYTGLNVASPISHALLLRGHHLIAGFVGVGAVAGLTTVMLVLFYGLTRVFLAMARDGLLPDFFAKINEKTSTPMRIIIPCGILMASCAALVPINELAELVNVGTLFAFMVVCAGVLYLRHTRPELHRPFKTPGVPYTPMLGLLSCFYLLGHLPSVTLVRFVIWLGLGLTIYFLFSRKNSILAR